jgi:hypothetical protein
MAAQFGGVMHRNGVYAAIVARDDAFHVEAVIYDGFKNLRLLPRDFGPPDAADQFLALAAEHPSGNNFYPPTPCAKTIHPIILLFLLVVAETKEKV